ncbi:MAG: S8 family peptidase [Lishizhenia sp.]
MIKQILSLIVLLSISTFSCAQVKKFQFDTVLNEFGDRIVPFSLPNTTKNLNFLVSENIALKRSTKDFLFISATPNWIMENTENGNLSDFYYNFSKPVALDDTARAMHFVNEVHNGVSPLKQSFTGEGVIIGYVDQGLDFNHPDFIDENGVSRVLRYWDHSQAANSTTPALYGYGTVCDSASIADGTCSSTEAGSAHGTTVTGIGSGNGLSNNTNSGMAPKSNIIVVETNFSLPNWTLSIADACDYIFKVADSLGMPAIVNLSLGTYLGSHDGNDPAAEMIEALLDEKEGRIVVSAAGNSGNWGKYHVNATVDQDTSFVWFLNNPSNALGANRIYFDLWSDNTDATFDFAFAADRTDFSFVGRTSFTNAQGVGAPVLYDTIYNENQERIATIEAYPETIGSNYRLQVLFSAVDSVDYLYRFETKGTGSYDLWTSAVIGYNEIVNVLPSPVVMPSIIHYNAPDSLQTIVSSWNCSEKVVSVGNVRARTSHIDNNGNVYAPSDVTSSGELSPNSSKGPTRNGTTKPNIAASGDVTLAAGPLFVINNPAYNAVIDSGGFHVRNGGTSMASPTVAGIAALYLEQCNTATYQDFMLALEQSAIEDNFTGATPNFAYGFGKVHAFDLMTQHYPTITNQGTTFQASSHSNYQWFLNDTQLPGETNASITPTQGGFYYVGVDIGSGCYVFSDSLQSFAAVEENLKDVISIFPNPTSGIVRVNTKNIEILRFELTNVLGQQIPIARMKDNGVFTLDFSQQTKGVYFLTLFTQNKKHSIKVIKE